MKRSFLGLALVVPLTLVDAISEGRQYNWISVGQNLRKDERNPPESPEPVTPAGDTTGGGSRSPLCYDTDNLLMAVQPADSDRSLTISQQPTLWIYFPYTQDVVDRRTFTINNLADTEMIYEAEFQLPETPGFVSITPNLSEGTLQEGEYYRWYVEFEVDCPTADGSSSRIKSVSLEGAISRVAANGDRQASIDAGEPDIWYDSFTRLSELRRDDPNDSTLQAQWEALLQFTHSEELDAIVGEPILDPATIVEDTDVR